MNYLNNLFFSIDYELSFWILLVVFILYIFLQLVPWKKVISFLRNKFLLRKESNKEDIRKIAQELYESFDILKSLNKGATIIIKGTNSLNNYVDDPILLDAVVSSELIINIFEGENSPLHDGAVIIEENKIRFSGAYINFLSSKENLLPSFGTRHRSAIGLTEKTDAIAIILSEETGNINFAKNGNFTKISINDFEKELINLFNI